MCKLIKPVVRSDAARHMPNPGMRHATRIRQVRNIFSQLSFVYTHRLSNGLNYHGAQRCTAWNNTAERLNASGTDGLHLCDCVVYK